MQAHCQTGPLVSQDTVWSQTSLKKPNRDIFVCGFLHYPQPYCTSDLRALGLPQPMAAGSRDTARTRHGLVNCYFIIQAGQREKWALQILQRLGV